MDRKGMLTVGSEMLQVLVVAVLEYLVIRYGVRTGAWFLALLVGGAGVVVLFYGGLRVRREIRRVRHRSTGT